MGNNCWAEWRDENSCLSNQKIFTASNRMSTHRQLNDENSNPVRLSTPNLKINTAKSKNSVSGQKTMNPPSSLPQNSIKVDINFNITTHVKKQENSMKEEQKSHEKSNIANKTAPMNLKIQDVIEEEASKYEEELANEEEVKSVSSVSDSKSSSEFDINNASIPKIRISNYDEVAKETVKRFSSNKLNFDPKNLIKASRAKLEELYEFSGKLGKGSYGEVLELTLKSTGETRAWKCFLKSKYAEDKISVIKNEAKILKMMDHPNIVKVYDYYEDEDNFFIVMEYWKGGELFEHITKVGVFTEEMASNIMKQILSAMSYLHSQNIIHSDLKAENIMFVNDSEDDYHWKLIDFGMATKHNNPDEKMSRIQGTPYYIAPDVLRNSYDSKADIWSLGVLVFILLTGTPPFRAPTLKEIFKKILVGKVDFKADWWKNLSQEAIDFIKMLMKYEPTERPTASECLKLPWITKHFRNCKKEKMVSAMAIMNLKKFNSERKLEIAVISYIANYLTSSQNNQMLRDTFQMMDKDNDGVLSKQELITGLTKIYGNKAFLAEEIDQLLDNIDLNGNGVIDYSEFVTATADYKKLCTENNLKQAFDKFDLDGNGEITLEELREVLGGDEADEDIKNIIKAVDKNGDGQINFEEFKDMMLVLYRRNSMLCTSGEDNLLSGFGMKALYDTRRVSMFN
jgi:calcium-dependent protein kinase